MRKALIVKVCFFAVLLVGMLVMVSNADEPQPAVNSLKVETQGSGAKIVIEKTGALECQDFVLSNPDRLIVDFVGAKHHLPGKEFPGDGRVVRKVRTSQFANEPDNITRVVFDLKEKSSHTIRQEDGKVVIELTPRTAAASPKKPELMGASMASAPLQAVAQSEPAQKPVVETPQVPVQREPAVVSERTSMPQRQASFNQSASNPEATLASAWQRSQPNRAAAPSYMSESAMQGGGMGASMNKNITLDVQNADITTVLQSFSEFAGINIISGPEVTGDVEVHLKDVPWKQALQIVLKSYGFGYEEQYGVIRVSTIDQLTKEELEKQAADRKKDDLLPLTTRIVTLAYANAEEMQKALKKMVTQRGNVEVEKGSNSLIVTDIEKNVEKIATLAQNLDRKINQVEIVAKLVDVDIAATTEMGIRWDFLNISPADGGIIGDGVVDAGMPSPVGKFRVGTVRSWGELRAVIDMLEQSNRANIISNPRIVTADNREASILVGKEIPLIVADEAGNPITELTKVGIGLRVTPHINLDQTITLDLHPEVSELSSQATVQGGVIISVSEADTRVMVRDGETAVIGGLMSQVESTLERGLPVLKDVPILGNLFKYKNVSSDKRELIIFITPRIVDNEMAAN